MYVCALTTEHLMCKQNLLTSQCSSHHQRRDGDYTGFVTMVSYIVHKVLVQIMCM